jgi:hypothetical protein
MSLNSIEPTSAMPSLPPPGVAAPRRSPAWANVVLGLALVVAVGGVAFAAGRGTAPPATATGRGVPGGGTALGNGSGSGGTGAGASPGAGRFPGGGPGGTLGGGLLGAGGGLSVEGTVVSVTADGLTLRLESGATIEIGRNGQTTYHRQDDGTADDVVAGGTVIVRLSSDFGGRVGGPAASPAPSGSSAGPIGTAGDITVVP